MRRVTIKPPKILIETKITARKPTSFEKLVSAGPAAIKAPTIITDEIALVIAIRGEWRAGVTRQTT